MSAEAQTESTLMLVVKRLTPRLLALVLVSALVLLAVVIMYALANGGSVDLKKMTFTAHSQVSDEIIRLKQDSTNLRQENKTLINQIETLKHRPSVTQLQQCENQLNSSLTITQISSALGEAIQVKDSLSRIQELGKAKSELNKMRQNFYFKLFQLELEIAKFGTSIATHYPTEQRYETYRLIQDILLELEFYDGELDGKQRSTRRALEEFQATYNKELKNRMPEAEAEQNRLKPIGIVGYRTLEAMRSWYRRRSSV